MLLESYVQGRWVRPEEEGEPLLDASTDEEVARIAATTGPDLRAVLNHARTVGGPALRELTFHQRATMLKEVALQLQRAHDELYALSTRTGATRADSDIDVGGGIGTLFAYASKAKRELPNDTVYLDGGPESLSRRGTFVAQHLCTPLRGVAVQVNAYNFPVWGMLEKLAPALIAGVPTVVKPAPQTAYLTELVVRRIVESGVLPEGALQLVCGPPRDLLDHLTGQDLVGFTGSARTAAVLRAHPAVVSQGVRFNAEADSLNSCVLGPDATPGTPEHALFVAEVVREMTAKAGQKCTAIRRAFVPRALLAATVEALREALSAVVVGDPRDEATTMGALVSHQQRDAVRRAVAALGGDVVVGDPSYEHGRGAFLPPLLVQGDAGLAAVHEVEAFGPVSTVLAYDDPAEVPGLLARGQGSLVASVVTADHAFARDVVLGAAAFHGRVMVLDRTCAKESTGHGSPMPSLVHGGPGRAGGGEELGGMRGVLHHMQRTAVQGSPQLLTAVTGRWTAGAERVEDGVHPFRKSLRDLRIGDSVLSASRTVTQDDIDRFVELTGDSFYAHTDPEAAAANPLFGGIVAHGYLVLSYAAGLFVDPAPGPVLANYGLDALRFVTPVKPGDAISVALTCMQINPRDGADYGEVRWDAEVTNGDGEVCARYQLLTMVAKEPTG